MGKQRALSMERNLFEAANEAHWHTEGNSSIEAGSTCNGMCANNYLKTRLELFREWRERHEQAEMICFVSH